MSRSPLFDYLVETGDWMSLAAIELEWARRDPEGWRKWKHECCRKITAMMYKPTPLYKMLMEKKEGEAHERTQNLPV